MTIAVYCTICYFVGVAMGILVMMVKQSQK